MSEELIERAHKGYAAFNTGEPDWDWYAPDFEYTNYADAPWQPSPGRKGLEEWLEMAEDTASEWSVEIDEYEDLGERRILAVGRLRATFRATGIEDELPMVHLLLYDEDAKLARADTFYSRDQAMEAAGLTG